MNLAGSNRLSGSSKILFLLPMLMFVNEMFVEVSASIRLIVKISDLYQDVTYRAMFIFEYRCLHLTNSLIQSQFRSSRFMSVSNNFSVPAF